MKIISACERVMIDACRYYSVNMRPFRLYPGTTKLNSDIKLRSSKLIKNNFYKLETNPNYIRFDNQNKTTGQMYSRFIQIEPASCLCSTFIDNAYCHYILEIHRLEIAKKVLDPIKERDELANKSLKSRAKRGRPAKTNEFFI